MKNKRALPTILLLLLISLVCIASVFAHPGRTDSNGGHWDRKNGTYHFHSGESAGKNSSGSSSSSEYVPFTPPYEPPTDNPYRKENSNSDNDSASFDFWDYAVVIIFIFIFFVMPMVAVIYDVFIFDHLPRNKIGRLIDKLSEYQRQQEEILDIRLDLSILSLKIKIPDLYEIGTDNLPRERNCGSNWGNSFTMYKTAQGKKLHPKYNCCFATEPVHICRYRNRFNLSNLLCSKCSYSYILPDLSWYDEYIDCQKLKKSQSNKERRCQELYKEIETLHKKCNSTITKLLIVFSKRSRIALHEANALYDEMQSDINKRRIEYIKRNKLF